MNHCCRSSICSNRNLVLGNPSQQDSQENDDCHCSEQCFREALCECIGLKCNCEFEIGRDLVAKTGVLERVGNNYLLLRSSNNNNALLCELCDLKFVTVSC